jgi:hypothetical protein
MNAKERPDIAAEHIQRIKDLVSGKQRMPAVQYNFSRGGEPAHASELDGLCLQQAFYRRIAGDDYPMSDQAAMFFLRGRVVERAIATEQPPREYEGVICTIDDYHAVHGIIEIKSTAMDAAKFDILKSSPTKHWLVRAKTYCKAYAEDRITYVVYFLIGDSWTKRTKRVDMRAWTVTFTPRELDDNWKLIAERRDALMSALKDFEGRAGTSLDGGPDRKYASQEEWLCKSCDFSVICPHIKS